MNRLKSLARPLGLCTLAAALLFAPRMAQAQDVPSYARPAGASADETIHGRIRSVDGAFTISVDDDRGFVDEVQLHGGTIINPTGLTLSPGMSVTIVGYNAGSTFDANEIDTPYSYDGPLPAPVYYGDGYWCPGFAYGYGPSFGLAVIFGGGGWHYEHRPYYGRPWNGYGYFGHAVSFAPHGRDHVDEQRPSENPRRNAIVGREHAPPAFNGRSFAGEQRFSTESNAPAARPGGTAGGYRHTETGAAAVEGAGVRAAGGRVSNYGAGRDPNDGAAHEHNYGAGREPNAGAGREPNAGATRPAESARAATVHTEGGGRVQGGGRGEGGGGHGGGRPR